VTMMRGEKPEGHGERCVSVGTLDMAIWGLLTTLAEMSAAKSNGGEYVAQVERPT